MRLLVDSRQDARTASGVQIRPFFSARLCQNLGRTLSCVVEFNDPVKVVAGAPNQATESFDVQIGRILIVLKPAIQRHLWNHNPVCKYREVPHVTIVSVRASSMIISRRTLRSIAAHIVSIGQRSAQFATLESPHTSPARYIVRSR